MNKENIAKLIALARNEIWGDDDDFDPGDSGDFAEAYCGGFDDGQASLARTVLESEGISWDKIAIDATHADGACDVKGLGDEI